MHVLITGGAGYIGTELVHHLAAKPYVSRITVYDNLARKVHGLFLDHRIDTEKIRFIHADLLDSRRLRQVVTDADAVFHLAARVSTPFASDDPHGFDQVNNWGTAELVYAVEEAGIERLVYLSSASVYGSAEEPVSEASATDARTFYGISKRNGEKHVERLGSKLRTHILRCANVYGYSPSMRFDAVINRFMFEAHFSNRISIHGSGLQRRAFVHVKQVCDTLEQLLEQDVPSGIYNLVGCNVSVLEVAGMVKELYPQLEFLYQDQQVALANLQLSLDTALAPWVRPAPVDLKADLRQLGRHFSFKIPFPGGT